MTRATLPSRNHGPRTSRVIAVAVALLSAAPLTGLLLSRITY